MPLLLGNNPNPQAVMLGSQHLRKVMLGGIVVWQKPYTKQKPLSIGDLTLETLEYQEVKLKAANDNGRLCFPMFFRSHRRTDCQVYKNRLTFISDTVLSMQTIDAMLEADVVNNNLFFPMVFPAQKPTNQIELLNKLTFIEKE